MTETRSIPEIDAGITEFIVSVGYMKSGRVSVGNSNTLSVSCREALARVFFEKEKILAYIRVQYVYTLHYVM